MTKDSTRLLRTIGWKTLALDQKSWGEKLTGFRPGIGLHYAVTSKSPHTWNKSSGTSIKCNIIKQTSCLMTQLHVSAWQQPIIRMTCIKYLQECWLWSYSACLRESVKISILLHLVYYLTQGTTVAQWLRYCATNRKVAGSIPDDVIGIFHWHNPSDRTMAMGSTQPLTEMSTRSISWG
jgi:hypothetical protein